MQDKPAPGLMVLSMHQPWASLLVYGLKRIEGRGWSTDYTGRLWIHATSTRPSEQDIEASVMEAWGALPDTIKQEIGSPFCFLCETPKRLVVPQQMRGYPKLWQLPSKTATTLTAALKAPPDPVPFSWAQFGKPDTHDATANDSSSRSSFWYEKYGKAKKEQSRKL